MFHVEVTDTFGDEANYAWVRYFLVKATTYTGAIRKVGQEMGFAFRKSGDYGDSCRYQAQGACVCAFVTEGDEQSIAAMKGNAKGI